jgi:hypothetical protein
MTPASPARSTCQVRSRSIRAPEGSLALAGLPRTRHKVRQLTRTDPAQSQSAGSDPEVEAGLTLPRRTDNDP